MSLGLLVVHYFSGDLLDSEREKIPLTLCPMPLNILRPNTPTPATTPIIDWNTTLPALGSKYAKKLTKCNIKAPSWLKSYLALNQISSIH
jgi:hypothetical protein